MLVHITELKYDISLNKKIDIITFETVEVSESSTFSKAMKSVYLLR